MRKVLVLLLAITLLFGLCACGSGEDEGKETQDVVVKLPDNGKKAPSEEIIMEDIRNKLMAKNQYASLVKVETIKSLTDEGSYVITVSITAETKYADWTYEADLSYTKYDQGWMLDDVDWVSECYKQVRLPELDTMVEHATEYLSEHEVYSDVSYSDYMVPMYEPGMDSYFDVNQNLNVVRLTWNGKEQLKHAEQIHDCISLWIYEPKVDNWILMPNEEHGSLGYCVEWNRGGDILPNTSLDFSGYWHRDETNALGSFSHTVEITSFSWEGFDACIPEVSSQVTHYECTTDAPYEVSYGADLIFTNGKNEYIIFMFAEDSTAIKYFGETGYVLVHVTDDLPILS